MGAVHESFNLVQFAQYYLTAFLRINNYRTEYISDPLNYTEVNWLHM